MESLRIKAEMSGSPTQTEKTNRLQRVIVDCPPLCEGTDIALFMEDV